MIGENREIVKSNLNHGLTVTFLLYLPVAVSIGLWLSIARLAYGRKQNIIDPLFVLFSFKITILINIPGYFNIRNDAVADLPGRKNILFRRFIPFLNEAGRPIELGNDGPQIFLVIVGVDNIHQVAFEDWSTIPVLEPRPFQEFNIIRIYF